MIVVDARIADIAGTVPWFNDCHGCDSLREDIHPGLSTYVLALCHHFENDHNIAFREAGND